MNTILIISGSARPNSINQVIVREVSKKLEQKLDVAVRVADLAELALPYFDSSTVPAVIDSETTPQSVKNWSSLVKSSDGLVFVSPEYNHSLSGIQKNAIDWLYGEWRDMPTAFVGYGAYAGKHVYKSFREISQVIRLQLVETMAGVMLGEVIDYDGSIIDQGKLDSLLEVTLAELTEAVASA